MLHLANLALVEPHPSETCPALERGAAAPMGREAQSWLCWIGSVHPFMKMYMNPPAMGAPNSANVNKVTPQAWGRRKYLITSLVFLRDEIHPRTPSVSFGLFSHQQEFPPSNSDLISITFPPAGSVMIFRMLCPKKDPMEAVSSHRTASLTPTYPGVWGASQDCSIPSPHQDPVQTSPSDFTY